MDQQQKGGAFTIKAVANFLEFTGKLEASVDWAVLLLPGAGKATDGRAVVELI